MIQAHLVIVHAGKSRILSFGEVLTKCRIFVTKYRKSSAKAKLKELGYPRRLPGWVATRW